jgi:hypothetical protein
MERKYIVCIVLSAIIIIGLIAFIIKAIKEKFNYRSIRPMFSSRSFVPIQQPDLDYRTTNQSSSAIADQNKVDCVMRRLFYNGKCTV